MAADEDSLGREELDELCSIYDLERHEFATFNGVCTPCQERYESNQSLLNDKTMIVPK
jgi:hypothetical protein